MTYKSFFDGTVERLMDALKDCAAPFVIGDNNGLISRETLAREFSRRQQVAARAIGQPLCSDIARDSRLDPRAEQETDHSWLVIKTLEDRVERTEAALREIIGRAALERATGPSGELDAEIAKAIGKCPQDADEFFSDHCMSWQYKTQRFRDGKQKTFDYLHQTGELPPKSMIDEDSIGEFPMYTASLDAALTLVPEGMKWSVALYERPMAFVHHSPDGCILANAKTPALALCIASLRARAGG